MFTEYPSYYRTEVPLQLHTNQVLVVTRIIVFGNSQKIEIIGLVGRAVATMMLVLDVGKIELRGWLIASRLILPPPFGINKRVRERVG